MSYRNIQSDSNFYLQSFNQDGFRVYIGPVTSYTGEYYRSIYALTDCVVSATSLAGDSLSNIPLQEGIEIFGLFSSVTITSGTALAINAGPYTNPAFDDSLWNLITNQWQLLTNTWN